MAVTRTSVGAFNAGTVGITIAFGVGATAGDLGLLFVETANQALPSTPSGWTQEVQAGFGTAAAAGATMLSVYSKQSITSGDISGGIAIGDSGDHQCGRLVTYSGYDTTTPIVITESGQDTSTASTSVIISTAVNSTTITANDIALAAVATDKDTSTSSTNSAQTWNNIAGSRSNIINNSTINGAGGGLIVDELVPSGSQSAAVTFTETITASAWIGRIVVIKASSGSGTTFNDNFTESLTASDSLANAATFANAITESLTASTTFPTAATFPNAISESLTASDSLAAGLVIAVSFSEGLTTSDTLGVGAVFLASILESVTASDSFIENGLPGPSTIIYYPPKRRLCRH